MTVVASRPVANNPAVLLCTNAASGTASDLSVLTFLLKNLTKTASVWLGPSGVTDSTGFEWQTSDTALSIDLEPGESLYGYALSAQTIHVLKAGR